MTDDKTRLSGASIRRRVLGDSYVERMAKGDPFLAPFFEAGTEHIWGGLCRTWTARMHISTSPSRRIVCGNDAGQRAAADKLVALTSLLRRAATAPDQTALWQHRRALRDLVPYVRAFHSVRRGLRAGLRMCAIGHGRWQVASGDRGAGANPRA